MGFNLGFVVVNPMKYFTIFQFHNASQFRATKLNINSKPVGKIGQKANDKRGECS
jgi:hypothetical protein